MAEFTIAQAYQLAVHHHKVGRLREAEELYRQILSFQPEHVGALHMLGLTERQAGHNEVATELFRRAIALRPDWAEAHCNLGNALKDLRRVDAAIIEYNEAIRHKPGYALAHYNLANALRDKKQFDGAMAAYRRALDISPDLAEAHNNLGTLLQRENQFEQSIEEYRRALACNPNFPEAYNNLGNACRDIEQFDQAAAAYQQCFALRPNYAEAHYNFAILLLTRGDFQNGWEEYEWRLRSHEMQTPRVFAEPMLFDQEIRGRTILVHAEQGLGDTIQGLRYLPILQSRGGTIIVEVQEELKSLARHVQGAAKVLQHGEALPPFDFHCPIMSLPRVLRTTLDSIPNRVPYLSPDPRLTESWRMKLSDCPPGPRIGLIWAGNPEHINDHNRSIALAMLSPLSAVQGVHFFSLQKTFGPSTAAKGPLDLVLIDRTAELNDLSDTAAMIAQLDLVISVDTSVAHLAGAMGKPVWVLLPTPCDWRWLLEREDSPWYPTMRLFRQKRIGDWGDVVQRVGEALRVVSDRSRR
jgi:tetratricopeptide (TPR) repeat protein